MSNARQTDFSGGELDPLLHGRTDLPIFGKGCRTLKNFVVTKHGAAMSRPGTTFISKTAFPDPPGGFFSELNYGKVRLVPFVASDDVSYVLEFTYQAIRFYSRNARIETAPGVPYAVTQYTKADGTLATFPYTWALLSRITYSQIGDSLILCHPQFPAIELRRNGHTNWAAREISLRRPDPQYCDTNNPAQVTTAFNFVTSVAGSQNPRAADPDHPKREWDWVVSALVQDPDTGEKYETFGQSVRTTYDGVDYDGTQTAVTNLNVNVYRDQPITLRRAETAALLTPVDLHIIAYNIYRGRGELYGFLGTTTSREFIDLGDEPNYAIQPPRGTNPFQVKDAAGSVSRTENPVAVTHFQARRIFGGTFDEDGITERRMDTLFMSAVEDFFDFDAALIIDVPGESLEFTLAAQRREGVRHLVSSNKALVGTNSSWWSVDGGVGQPIDFDHIEAQVIDEVGVNFTRPCIVDKSVLFARTKGIGVRALVAKGQDAYEALDVSQLSQHLFTGADKSIIDMSYAEDPWGVLWVVLLDGTLLSLTYVREGMVAWTRHEVDGDVEAVCCVPETDEDGVYLVVKRTINGVDQRYVERMTSRHERGGAVVSATGAITTPPDFICIDSALSYVGAAAQIFTGLGHLEGKAVYVIAEDQPVLGPFTVTAGQINVGSVLPVNVTTDVGPKLLAYVGLPFVCDLELLDIAGAEARLRRKQVTHVGFEVTQSKGWQIGQDFDHLTAVPERAVSDGFGATALRTLLVKCPIKGHSDLSARACLRQAYPLPATVVGFTRRLAVGDDS